MLWATFIAPTFSGIMILVAGFLLQRAAKRVEEGRKTHEQRLARMERTLNKHTRSLSALSKAQKLSLETITRQSDDIADLEEIVEQLDTGITVARNRLEKIEEFTEEVRRQRLARRVD